MKQYIIDAFTPRPNLWPSRPLLHRRAENIKNNNELLAQRVHQLEYQHYPQAVENILKNK